MNGKLRVFSMAGALACCMATVACDSGRSGPGRIELKPADPQVLQLGQKIYAAHCVACHGAKLEGQPNWRERDASGRLPAPPHDASGHTWHHPDEQLFAITKHGVAQVANLKDYPSSMPVYGGVLSDAEIVAVLSWIKSQWPADIQARHDRINEAAEREPVRRLPMRAAGSARPGPPPGPMSI
ncbi:c-type cytochrome [Ramlibacter sp.]|uniref:c-type cytochrome n=1 Tax=Ramlibacter sp. TaxID=1917967 RepID=UPI003FA6AE28